MDDDFDIYGDAQPETTGTSNVDSFKEHASETVTRVPTSDTYESEQDRAPPPPPPAAEQRAPAPAAQQAQPQYVQQQQVAPVDAYAGSQMVQGTLPVPSHVIASNLRERNSALYIGRIPWYTTDLELRQLISSFGITDIVNIEIYDDKTTSRSRGCAAVEFSSSESAAIVTQKISDEDIQIDGNRLEAQLIAPEMLTQRVTNKMVPLGTLPLPEHMATPPAQGRDGGRSDSYGGGAGGYRQQRPPYMQQGGGMMQGGNMRPYRPSFRGGMGGGGRPGRPYQQRGDDDGQQQQQQDGQQRGRFRPNEYGGGAMGGGMYGGMPMVVGPDGQYYPMAGYGGQQFMQQQQYMGQQQHMRPQRPHYSQQQQQQMHQQVQQQHREERRRSRSRSPSRRDDRRHRSPEDRSRRRRDDDDEDRRR